ncbi:MaoC/PaaZ C-terminal domain-containing protein [Streptomyces canus]|uniref:MaoC/PaaZ C-terminal domain-containing protein n=1 Tax=Streptomyces canus TaxID=58343 RepID=UPI0027861DC5|nr:acyl dehydratase [Streptomyces canus]
MGHHHSDDHDRFADVTGDRQWIPVDPEKAAKGPCGTTVAHGYLAQSLTAVLLADPVAADIAAPAAGRRRRGLGRARVRRRGSLVRTPC